MARDDVISVPAGTIHAMGADVVALEIQQRSDATYRLFDFGRQRETHATQAVAAARLSVAPPQPISRQLDSSRTVLLSDPHFALERIDLPPFSTWALDAPGELWAFILKGSAGVGKDTLIAGDVWLLDSDSVTICVQQRGVTALIAYPAAAPITHLLRSLEVRALNSIPMTLGVMEQ